VPDTVSDGVRHICAINAYIIQFLQNMDRWMSESGKVEVEMPNGQKVTLDSIRALQAAVNSRGAKNTALKSSRGWWECGDTGIIYQWGVVEKTGDETVVVFPVDYPNMCFNIQLTLGNARGNSASNIIAYSASNSGFVYVAYSQELWSYWFAVGC
ncbi:hypothetical protein KKJ09_21960, partial [Xenorhabdus bovienii]|nr:hypothetical protein [Xenorhabdus bovienii]MDE9504549.1 hypothetical protein [Xenorhabdus bovienii]MDE9528294.1 hypothetical protein [Xenorhabdus bovienii]